MRAMVWWRTKRSGDLAVAVALTNALANGGGLLGGELGHAAKPLVTTLGFGNSPEGPLPDANPLLLKHRREEAKEPFTHGRRQVEGLAVEDDDGGAGRRRGLSRCA
jgi:hypothetical protein